MNADNGGDNDGGDSDDGDIDWLDANFVVGVRGWIGGAWYLYRMFFNIS